MHISCICTSTTRICAIRDALYVHSNYAHSMHTINAYNTQTPQYAICNLDITNINLSHCLSLPFTFASPFPFAARIPYDYLCQHAPPISSLSGTLA